MCERISVSGIIVCILTANKFNTLYLFSDSFCDANKYVGLSKDVAKRSAMWRDRMRNQKRYRFEYREVFIDIIHQIVHSCVGVVLPKASLFQLRDKLSHA